MSYNPATHSPDSSPSYDVFLSFAGPDREQGRRFYAHLGKAGLRVFFDEHSIEVGKSITAEIQHGISSSKLFVAYYSRHLTYRDACQAELCAAYIAAQQSGNSGRLIVINPEESTDHIFPKSLTDSEHLISTASFMPNSTTWMTSITQAISKQALSLDGGIGIVPNNHHPNRRGPRKFWTHNITRYPRLWDIHTALTDNNTGGLVKPEYSSVLVTGQPGVGKTSTVNRYIHYFGAAFSNVYWQQYDRSNSPLNIQQIGAADQSDRFTLRVVDNIPADISLDDFHRLLPPAPNTCNILIGLNNRLQNILPTVTIEDLSPEEARAFISRYRSPESDTENEALDRLVDRMSRNASIVHQMALKLEDMQGIISYDDL
ncbi:MAG TPA: TIR domain-containing protein [Candidatus Saccharimonadales bacterium]